MPPDLSSLDARGISSPYNPALITLLMQGIISLYFTLSLLVVHLAPEQFTFYCFPPSYNLKPSRRKHQDVLEAKLAFVSKPSVQPFINAA